MNKFVCPLCGSTEKCAQLMLDVNGYIKFHCDHYNVDYSLSDDIINLRENDLKEKVLNLATEHLLHNKGCCAQERTHVWHFFYDPCEENTERSSQYINLADSIKNYPDNVIDVANRVLMNLAIKYPNYGDTICAFYADRRMLFEHNTNNHNDCGTLQILADLGYLKDIKNDQIYTITAEGWKKIDESKKKNLIRKQAFIAMQFGDETKSIRESFRKAISESGYSVKIIDEKEHNNQIVPEIFFEIEQSLFVVVDITYLNYGAYYEAGYAQALGKEVIVCCRKDNFDNPNTRPHFDIAQKSMIIWSNNEDLVSRLKRRIEATIK